MSIRNNIKLGILWYGSVLKRNRRSKILYYHDVFRTINHKALDADIQMGTSLTLFQEHIKVIREEGYEIVPHITKPEGQIAIMFDDGFSGIWECRDYFYKEGICPTVFLPANFIGRADLGIMTLEQIIELQSNGFIFESHGWSHRELTQFTDDELYQELNESKEALEKMLGKEVSGLCMPLGFFNNHLIKKIREAGYTDIYSCLPGSVLNMYNGMYPRNLCQYASSSEVKLILRGGNEIMRKRYIKLHSH